uniref:Macaca fascicularis brain cDNA clone: QbsB-10365, similar to human similar to VLLR9392 (LOC389118), mRNA, RefSeq: XM_371639.1 n=1 Tax=Macaca fascicularis TaxID=9541 RepID=I7GM55_MACFA|nr:unnamed protein product [Macaca fascicularis]
MHNFSHCQHPPPLVTIGEPTLTHQPHLKSIVYIRVHSWRGMICGFGQMYEDMYSAIIVSCRVFSLL